MAPGTVPAARTVQCRICISLRCAESMEVVLLPVVHPVLAVLPAVLDCMEPPVQPDLLEVQAQPDLPELQAQPELLDP